MNTTWHIAADSICCLVRQKLLWGLMLGTLALTIFFAVTLGQGRANVEATYVDVGPGGSGSSNSVRATSSFQTNGMSEKDLREFRDRMENMSSTIQALFYQVVSFGGSLVSLFIFSTAVSSEIRKGTVRLTLSKPVSRAQFLLGKYLGGVVIMAGYAVLASLAVILFAQTKQVELVQAIKWAPVLMFSRQLMLGSLAMLLSLFVHPIIGSVLAFFAGNGFYSSPNPLYFILPSYNLFNVFFQITEGTLLHPSDVLALVLYALDFVAMMLALALWRFKTKELV